MHLTLKKETTRPPGKNALQQQARFDDFIREFNGERPHEVPFGPQALALATEAPFSFNGWSKAKRRADQHTGIADWTVHDLRRTFATLHARIGTSIHVTEAYLDHSSRTISGVAAIYIRHDFMKDMREAILRYEDFIFTLVSP
jgi:integrase